MGWNYFLEGLGVAVGLVGGIVVWIIYGLLMGKKGEKTLLRNVASEFRMNIKQIDTLLGELNRCRTAIGAQALHKYFGHFDLYRCNWIATNRMFSSGFIYKYLKEDDIDKLLGMFRVLRGGMSDYMNGRITESKESTAPEIKTRLIDAINYWEAEFKDDKKDLEGMIEKLKSV